MIILIKGTLEDWKTCGGVDETNSGMKTVVMTGLGQLNSRWEALYILRSS